MNISDHQNINENYLAKWFNKEISDKDIRKFISEKDFQSYSKIRKGLDYFAPPEFNSERLQQNILKHTNKKQSKVFHLKWYAVAATIALLIISAYFFNASLPVHYQTNFGEQKTIVLNDGSEAILNAKSYIQYNKKWTDKRELDLRGEAFFKVKKGKSFTVNTNNGKVTVLGTQFIVKSQANFFLVKCFEGKVRVIQQKDTIYLTKGKAYQSNAKEIDSWEFLSDAPVWLNGESSFKSVPLKIVIISLENQFGIRINSDKVNTNQIFTGSFSHKDIDIALKSVFLPMGITYKVKNKKVVLLKK